MTDNGYICKEEDLQRLRKLRPIDDLVIVEEDTQYDIKRLVGARSICLDVNGSYEGDSDIGKLMHDFRCTRAEDMNYSIMADKTRYYKENPKGVSEMCKIIEDMKNEAAKKAANAKAIEIAKSLIALKEITLENIAKVTKLPIEEIRKLAEI